MLAKSEAMFLLENTLSISTCVAPDTTWQRSAPAARASSSAAGIGLACSYAARDSTPKRSDAALTSPATSGRGAMRV
jgi:hypothetical protein